MNALAPADRDIGVVGQIRDELQHTARIEYDVKPQWITRLLLLLFGVAALSGVIVARKVALI